jgi:hypothetical protein
MSAHLGFDTTVVHADGYWELWSIWCVGRLLGCYRARYDTFASVEHHQRELIGQAWNHSHDELARSAALELCCSRQDDGRAVTTFHDAAHAIEFYARGHGDSCVKAAAIAFVRKVDTTCKDTSHHLPGYYAMSRKVALR